MSQNTLSMKNLDLADHLCVLCDKSRFVMSFRDLTKFLNFSPIICVLIYNTHWTFKIVFGVKKVRIIRREVRYITDIDLVNDNEYTKFSLILSIRSQVIE